jgi:endonuclease G
MKRKTTITILVAIAILIVIYFWIRPENGQMAGSIAESPGPPNLVCRLPEIESGYPHLDNDSSQLLKYSGFHLAYSELHEQAAWVAYILTAEMVLNGVVERTDNFRPDTNIASFSASLADYRGSGYDRGHLAPAGDMQWSKEAMNESFLMSNMSPQVPQFNRQMWRYLESYVRDWAVDNDSIYVVTGPVLSRIDSVIGENNVAVPHAYFKVILDISHPSYKGIAFLMENKKLMGTVLDYAITIDSLESLTGFDFFPSQDKTSMDWIEANLDLLAWR